VADLRYVEPGALPLLGVPLVAGRDVEPQDLAGAPFVVLVNRAFAQLQFPGVDPLGRRLWLGNERGRWRTIVGVVGDVHLAELERPVEPTLWAPFAQATFPGALRTVSLVAKTPLPAAEALRSLRAAISSFDALQAPTRPRPLAQAIASSLAPRRFQAGLYNAFALLAAALAAAGVYGVTAYSVASRRDEFGLRLALGADTARLARLVLGEALRLGGLGLGLGLAGALAGARLLSASLVEVRPWDAGVLAAVGLGILSSALVASAVPALRAARTPPAQALRGA
jgi:hypothetical protein